VFKVLSFGLCKCPESSPLVDCFVDNRLFEVSPHVYSRCHGYCRWFSTALNLLLANAHKLMKCNCLSKITDICAFLIKPCQKVIGVRFLYARCISFKPIIQTYVDISKSYLGLFINVEQRPSSYRLWISVTMRLDTDYTWQRRFLDIRLWCRVVHILSQVVIFIIHCITSSTSRCRSQRSCTAEHMVIHHHNNWQLQIFTSK